MNKYKEDAHINKRFLPAPVGEREISKKVGVVRMEDLGVKGHCWEENIKKLIK